MARRVSSQRAPRTVIVLLAGLVALIAASAARAGAQEKLAARYAPVIRLVEQTHECGPGEPYRPIDINAILGQDTVALRGPWNRSDLIKVAPTAADLGRGLYEYHLDFPGNPLAPGCDYERWARHVSAGTKPTVYAHVATDPGYPGKLALQYWIFYVFNDFNNTHEGDWEMIQLNFNAANAGQALERRPTDVGYSQHEGAERAAWGDEKLNLVGGTHPVVYVAAGSHANFYDSALFIGRSASEGVGCDDTRGPHFPDIRPVVRTIASNPAAARGSYPWIAFEGRWGELQRAFFNGPTGPNLKTQWTHPIAWAQSWRSRSYAIPAGGVLGTSATDFFCGAVARGSNLVRRLANNPLLVVGVLAALVLLMAWLAAKATWRPGTPLRLARRRSWGQTVSATWRMYFRQPLLFNGIGLLTIPISVAVTLLQSGIVHASSFLGLSQSGEGAGDRAWLVLVIGTILSLLGLLLVQAAVVRAMAEIDTHRPVSTVRAYRLALERIRPMAATIVVAVPVLSLLSLTVFLIPVAIVLAVRWALIAPCVQLESHRGAGALRRSGSLVRRQLPKVLSLIVMTALLVLVSGPVLGGLLLLGTGADFWLINAVAGLVYALTMPLVGIATTYIYYDALVREHQAEPVAAELPAEMSTG